MPTTARISVHSVNVIPVCGEMSGRPSVRGRVRGDGIALSSGALVIPPWPHGVQVALGARLLLMLQPYGGG